MFADNQKISAHQVSYLLFVDWIAKLLLLLPMVRGSLSGWDFIVAVALGGLWMYFYLMLLGPLNVQAKGGFTGYLKERLGKYPAYLIDVLFLIYLVINLTYLARLTGRICHIFLLPETSETMIAVVMVAVGAATAFRDNQVRARATELLFYPVAAALAVMLLASMGTIKLDNIRTGISFDAMQILIRSGMVFAAFGGITLFLYEMPHINCVPKGRILALRKGLLSSLIFLLAAFVAALGVLGEGSLNRLPWPILTLMSSASLPGGFLQRWDAVFLAFLLFSLLVAAGTSGHYMKRILGEMIPQKKKCAKWVWALFVLTLVSVLLMGEFDMAAGVFVRWSFGCLVPFMTVVPVFLLILERIKNKCVQSE